MGRFLPSFPRLVKKYAPAGGGTTQPNAIDRFAHPPAARAQQPFVFVRFAEIITSPDPIHHFSWRIQARYGIFPTLMRGHSFFDSFFR